MTDYPRRGQTYRFAELRKLLLPDAPYLIIRWNGVESPVQTSHVTDECMLKANPALADTIWRYVRTTHEDCPIFTYVGEEKELPNYFKIEEVCDDFIDCWVTPKGCPREYVE